MDGSEKQLAWTDQMMDEFVRNLEVGPILVDGQAITLPFSLSVCFLHLHWLLECFTDWRAPGDGRFNVGRNQEHLRIF